MRDRPNLANLLVVLAFLAATFAGGGFVLELADDDGDGRTDRVIVAPKTVDVPTTAKVDGPDADGKLDDRLTTSEASADRLEEQLESGQAELADPLREESDSPATTVVPGPLAADEVPGCRTRFVGNSSTRGSARPRLIFLHQTVSREAGWSSQNALTGLAARRSSGVSWHLLVGRSGGRCTYTVPLALKAWTQGNANPWAVGIEVEAFGDEGSYVVGAGRTRLLSVVRYIAHRYSIPLRRGAVSKITCQPDAAGIVEHSDAGACGGGHIDVTHPPSDQAQAIARDAAAGMPTVVNRREDRAHRLALLTPGERRSARCLLGERRSAARNGGWERIGAEHRARANGCKAALERRQGELRRLGLTGRANRAARFRVIRGVLAAK